MDRHSRWFVLLAFSPEDPKGCSSAVDAYGDEIWSSGSAGVPAAGAQGSSRDWMTAMTSGHRPDGRRSAVVNGDSTTDRAGLSSPGRRSQLGPGDHRGGGRPGPTALQFSEGKLTLNERTAGSVLTVVCPRRGRGWSRC